MNAAFLIGGLALLALGGGLARNGIMILRGGADRLRSARARALAETAFGGMYAVLGVTAVILGFIGRHRLPTLVGTVILVAMLGLFAAAGVGPAAGRTAAWSERRHTRRAQRELGMVSPRPLWRVTTIGILWALAFVVACLVWAAAWSMTEGAAHDWRAASQQSVHRALVVLLAVTVPARPPTHGVAGCAVAQPRAAAHSAQAASISKPCGGCGRRCPCRQQYRDRRAWSFGRGRWKADRAKPASTARRTAACTATRDLLARIASSSAQNARAGTRTTLSDLAHFFTSSAGCRSYGPRRAAIYEPGGRPRRLEDLLGGAWWWSGWATRISHFRSRSLGVHLPFDVCAFAA
jgi:hypothetical protein